MKLQGQITRAGAFCNSVKGQDQTLTGYAPPVTCYHRHPGTALWGGLGAYPGYAKPFVLTARRNLPEGNIPLEGGAEVMDSEGARIGKVKSVYVEPEGHHITHLLVESGGLVQIPQNHTDSMDQERSRGCGQIDH